jgi:hypothetical protein
LDLQNLYEAYMPFGGQGQIGIANRFRQCADRLRSVAAFAPGDPITPEYVEELAKEYVEELAKEFDRQAEALDLDPVDMPASPAVGVSRRS